MTYRIELGDCLDVLRGLPDDSVDAVVTDPPYGIGFMGRAWDHGVPGVEYWREVLRVAKPGAHVVAFGGTRTYHRLAVAIEDAGAEIRDCLIWSYGSGFPKSHDLSKSIDKRGGYSHLTMQIGDALRSAREARGLTIGECDRKFCQGTSNWSWFEGRPKGQRAPTPITFARIVTEWPELTDLASKIAEADREVVGKNSGDMGGLGGERLGQRDGKITAPATDAARRWSGWGTALKPAWEPAVMARKPFVGTVAGNVLRWGTGAINVDACRVGFASTADERETKSKNRHGDFSSRPPDRLAFGVEARGGSEIGNYDAAGRFPANLIHDGSAPVLELFPREAHRFFYTAKASRADRGAGNTHPTVKPSDLMAYVCRLVTPPGGLVLDPFMGSGSTGVGAMREGFRFLGIDRDPEYVEIARRRLEGEPCPSAV